MNESYKINGGDVSNIEFGENLFVNLSLRRINSKCHCSLNGSMQQFFFFTVSLKLDRDL